MVLIMFARDRMDIGIITLGSSSFWTRAFGPAIEKYGWDGFEHLIILSNVDEAEAKYAERYLVKWYHTNDSKFGYNCTGGGDGHLIHGCGFDPEHIRECNRKWEQENRERRHELAHTTYEKNKEKRLAKARERYQRNKEEIHERQREYRESHKEQLLEYYKRYHKAKREQKKLEKLKEETTL